MGEKIPTFGPPETPEEERDLILARSEYLLEQLGTDALTGLKNRKVFEEELSHMLKAIKKDMHHRPDDESLKKVALLFIDLDNFKRVNDTKGHLEGDKVLMQVADILKHSVRDSDIIARFGGDEFYILLPRADEAAALAVADKIHMNLDGDAKLRGYGVTASIGLRTVDSSTMADIKTLVHEVDEAAMKAKQGGKKQTRTQ